MIGLRTIEGRRGETEKKGDIKSSQNWYALFYKKLYIEVLF